MEVSQEKKLRNNPFFVITIACIIAVIMSLISFLLYYNSDTRRTVEQLQINTQQLNEEAVDLTANQELSDAYIDTIEKEISDSILVENDEADFSAAELTDSALGL